MAIDVVEYMADGNGSHTIQPNRAILRYPDDIRAEIENGTTVELGIAAGLDPGLVNLTICGPILGLLMSQRGDLVLHASAVRRGQGVVIILGESGAGKSTVAAAMCREGAVLVADDLVPVPSNGQPVTRAGYPLIKLFPELARRLAIDADDLFDLDRVGDKMGWAPPAFMPGEYPITAAYALSREAESPIDRVGAGSALEWILRSTYVAHLLATSSGRRAHFAAATRLISEVPVYVVRSDSSNPIAAARIILDQLQR